MYQIKSIDEIYRTLILIDSRTQVYDAQILSYILHNPNTPASEISDRLPKLNGRDIVQGIINLRRGRKTCNRPLIRITEEENYQPTYFALDLFSVKIY